MKTKTFFLFRHGETDWNRVGRLQGSADIPLNALGVSQAAHVRTFLSRQKILGLPRSEVLKSVVSSPLKRAVDTARIAFDLTDSESTQIRRDKRFAETHLGQAEGMTRDELILNFGEASWLEWIGLGPESWQARFPGGESKGEVRDRVLEALRDLSNEENDTWYIATHGGLLRRLLHHFHPNEQTPIDVVNGAVFKVVCENGVWSASKTPVFVPGP